MGGLLRWLLGLVGLAPATAASATPARPIGRAPPQSPAAARANTQHLTPEQFRLARRRVVAYVAQARGPIRQAAAVRQTWLADLGKVYAAIASSPTGVVLERAGQIGENHEPGFREALGLAQSTEPPPEAEACHAAMVGWLTALHSACLALIDARKLKDRAMLGSFREQLGLARRHAAHLVQERSALFAAYRLTVKAAIPRKQGAGHGADAPEVDEPARGTRPKSPRRRPGSRRSTTRPAPGRKPRTLAP